MSLEGYIYMAKKENKNKHEVTVKIEGDTWAKAIDDTFLEKQKTVKVDGFRKGKVPRSIYDKKFGEESLYLDASNKVIDEAYQKALEESNLIPVVRPDVSIKSVDKDGIEFTFTIITKPEVKIKTYKGLKIQREKLEITDDEIDHEIGHILERFTELVSKDGKVEEGDIAVIDFEGFKDGVAFDGGKGDNYSLEIGSHSFIPGFEEQVIGMKVGEAKDLNLTFPEDYGAKDLAGCDVVFKVKVNDIKIKKQREFDEDFFLDLGMDGVDSEEKLREEIRKSLEAKKDAEIENKHIDQLFEGIAKGVEVDIPEEMVDEEIDRLMKRFEEHMKMHGVSLDLYYQFTNTTEKDLKSQMEKEGYNNVLYRLMLEEILNQEKVEVTHEEAEKEAEELAEKYGMTKDDFLNEFGGIEMVQYDLEMRKVVELLKEYNK